MSASLCYKSFIERARAQMKKVNKETKGSFIHDSNIKGDSLLHYFQEHDLVTFQEFEKRMQTILIQQLKHSNKKNEIGSRAKRTIYNITDLCTYYPIYYALNGCTNLYVEDINTQFDKSINPDVWDKIERPFAISIDNPLISSQSYLCIVERCELGVNILIFVLNGDGIVEPETMLTRGFVCNETHKLSIFYTDTTRTGYGLIRNRKRIYVNDIFAKDNQLCANMDIPEGFKEYVDETTVLLTIYLAMASQYAIKEYFFYSEHTRRDKTIDKHSEVERSQHKSKEVISIDVNDGITYLPISSLARKLYSEKKEWQGGTHKPPCAHYRNDFERHYKNGKVVHIKGFAAGGTKEQKDAIKKAISEGTPIPFYGKKKKIYVTDI